MIHLRFSFISTPERKKSQQGSPLLAKGSWSIENETFNIKQREPRIRIEFDESVHTLKKIQVQVDLTPASPELEDLAANKTDPYYLHVSNLETCSLSTLGFECNKTLPLLTGSWDDDDIHVKI